MDDQSTNIEREVKLGAWAGLALPELSGVADDVRVVARPALRLSATYYDTVDLRLARWGVTVRYRTTETATTGVPAAAGSAAVPAAAGSASVSNGEKVELSWTVKLGVGGAPEGGLARRELGFSGRETRPPPAVTELVRGLSRGAPLVPVARLRTDRLRWRLLQHDKPVCEIDDDEVSVLVAGPTGRGRRLAARFRELEVELEPGGDMAILDAVVAELRAAGAGAPDPTPKVARALGPRASQPPDVVPGRPGRKASAAEVVRTAIAASVDRLIRHDPGVRLGEDPEDVHQARVATRRLRSDLRTLGSLLDETWTRGLRDELGWIAGLLGDVRDTDVLHERLERHAAGLAPADAKPAAALLARLAAHRSVARAALLVAFDSERYIQLLDRLVDAAREPVFAGARPEVLVLAATEPVFVGADPGGVPIDGGHTNGAGPNLERDVDRPAIDVLPALVKKPWSHLQRAVGSLGDDPADEQLHEVRIRAKRCRYAAEAVAPVVGKPAVALASAVADLQGLLGDFHDAIVAEEWLRNAAGHGSASQALVAGQLITVQRGEAQEGRDGWPALWKRASAKKLRAWLTGP